MSKIELFAELKTIFEETEPGSKSIEGVFGGMDAKYNVRICKSENYKYVQPSMSIRNCWNEIVFSLMGPAIFFGDEGDIDKHDEVYLEQVLELTKGVGKASIDLETKKQFQQAMSDFTETITKRNESTGCDVNSASVEDCSVFGCTFKGNVSICHYNWREASSEPPIRCIQLCLVENNDQGASHMCGAIPYDENFSIIDTQDFGKSDVKNYTRIIKAATKSIVDESKNRRVKGKTPENG